MSESEQYLQTREIGLPDGLPPLALRLERDGRHVFAGQTDEAYVWVQPKPQAWAKPLAGATPPAAQAVASAVAIGSPRGPVANYGLEMQDIANHRDRLETNDPGFGPAFHATPLRSASQQVPLPTAAEPAPSYSTWILIGAIVVAVLVILSVRHGEHR